MKPRKMKLTLLTPLHIGAEREGATPLNLILYQDKSYVINEERLFGFLNEKTLLDSFLNEIEEKEDKFVLTNFFKDKNLLEEGILKKVRRYSLNNPANLSPDKIKPFVRNGYARPYIPGTSLKGALRTAIMWKILKELKENNEPRFKEKIVQFIEEKLNFYEKKPYKEKRRQQDWVKKTFFSRGWPGLLELIFQGFRLPGAGFRYDAHTDILRVLKVSDTNSLDKDSLTLKKVEVLSKVGERYKLNKPTYLETIPQGKELNFSLKIDEELLENFRKENQNRKDTLLPFESIKAIIGNPLQAAREFTENLREEKKEAYFSQLGLSSFIPDLNIKEANLRLGWGSGLLGTTLVTLLDEPLRQRLRNLLFTNRGQEIAPKTRRVIVENYQPTSSLGWVRLEEE